MSDHVVSQSSPGRRLKFSQIFNVAVPFIDRHLDEGRGEKIAIRTNRDIEVSYSQLQIKVNRSANGLLALGLGHGDRLVMVIKDCAEFFYCFWGAIKVGIIPIPINTLLRSGDYRFIIADSQCRAVVYSPEFAAEVEPALDKLYLKESFRAPEHAIRTEGKGNSFQAMIAAAQTEVEVVPTRAEDDCFWLYSSGSTGNPKGTIHRHRDMAVTSQYYGVETLGVVESDICFSAAKLFFAFGLGNGMTFPLWVGGTTILDDARPTPDSTSKTIRKFRPTLYFGVPTLYMTQLQSMQTTQFDTSSVRYCVSAGEPLPGEILKQWRDRTGLDILDGIGSTETLHTFISNRAGDIRPGSSGRLVAGYQARILGDDDLPVATGESGQLMIKGDSIARSYWNNPQKTASHMMGEWLKTGDTYFQDEDGYYHYCGRNDDMIKVGGIWCSPFEIEATLMEHSAVLETAVIGRADDAGLVKPEAYVVLKQASTQTRQLADELTQHCKSSLAPYKYPRWIRFVDELPKTVTGKIQRYKLRALAVCRT